jgi:PAS domain S-box-containing protein
LPLLFREAKEARKKFTGGSGNIISWNKGAQAMFGYSEEEVMGKPLSHLMPERYREAHAKGLQRVRATGESQLIGKTVELFGLRKDGHEFPLELSLTTWQRGEETFYSGIIRDITTRKQAEQALRRSEEHFRSLIENASDIITIVNADGTIRYKSPSLERLLGYKPEELIGKSAFDLVHPDDLSSVLSIFKDGIQNPGALVLAEFRYRHKDGSWRTLESIGKTIVEDSGQVCMIVNSRDITERKQAEKALRESEARFAGILDLALEAIISIDEAQRIVLFNKGAEQIFGYTPDEVLGQPLAILIPEKFRSLHGYNVAEFGLSAATARRMGERQEIYGRRKNGEEFPGEASISKLEVAGRRIFTVVLRDITERRRIEAALIEERALLARRVEERTADLSAANAELAKVARLKDEFLASMSHELRTPLNAILGLSEALQEQLYGTFNQKQLKVLRTIEESGRHLLSLINDILDLSKIEAGKLALEIGPVSVDAVCQASLRLINQMAQKKKLTLSSTFDRMVSTIQADDRRLKQALVNLLSNAVKFTPEGGTIGLEVDGHAGQGVVRFTVWDTGIGISQKDMARLFQPFIQLDSSLSRQYSGTGLGLALVHRIVELHGGSVSVESEPGKGSRFTISLPWQKTANTARILDVGERIARTAPTSHLSEFRGVPGQEKRVEPPLILLAEDNESSINILSDYLLAKNYRIVVARNGGEAIDRAREDRPNLILMDIQMPSMDGLEVTRRIRADASLATIPIIALTALAMSGDRERCLQAGANEYMSKPISLKGLSAAIEQQLKQNGKYERHESHEYHSDC